MKYKLGFFIIVLCFQSLPAFSQGEETVISSQCSLFKTRSVLELTNPLKISNYEVQFRSCNLKGVPLIGLREFQVEEQDYGLFVNPKTLETQILDMSCVSCHETQLNDLPQSPYLERVRTHSSAPYPFFNDGLTHLPQQKGYFLTVDLCPSRKPFEFSVFDNLRVQSQQNFPVGVAITGLWMKNYPQEVNWLKNKVLNHQLDVVWINHSYSHPYIKSLPDKDNFLLLKGVNFYEEVIGQEQNMIANGLTPSIYFRFPGLISNEEQIKQIEKYGLVALASDAWLAIDQVPHDGSIILIHGNGNEPPGIRMFFKFLEYLKEMTLFKNLNLNSNFSK
jgi:hypothetical protein